MRNYTFVCANTFKGSRFLHWASRCKIQKLDMEKLINSIHVSNYLKYSKFYFTLTKFWKGKCTNVITSTT